jgi:hypothetical protein
MALRSSPTWITAGVLLAGLTVGALLPDPDAASVRPASVPRPGPRAPAGWHVWPPERAVWAQTDGASVTLVTPPDVGDAVTACFDVEPALWAAGRFHGTWRASVPDDARARVFVKTQIADRPAVATPITATGASVEGPFSGAVTVPDGATLVQLCVAAQGRGVRVALTVGDAAR